MIAVFFLALGVPVQSQVSEPPVVSEFDLASYLGKWYQIADYPQFYEFLCRTCTQANYALKPDGTVQVWNTCAYPGKKRTTGIEAYAFAPNADEPAKLTVAFFGAAPSNTNYWVSYLGPLNSDGLYSYAVVSDADRNTLYILSREPTLSEAAAKDIMKFLSENNFDTGKLRYTSQSNCPAAPAPPSTQPQSSGWGKWFGWG
eukprot:g8163.t1